MVTGLRLLASGEGDVISAGTWGKHKTVWQITAIIVIMLGVALQKDILPVVMSEGAFADLMLTYEVWFVRVSFLLGVLAAGITVLSGWVYFKDNMAVVLKEV